MDVVLGLANPEMLPYFRWVPGFVQGPSLCAVVVETVAKHCGSQLLGCWQWIGHQQLLGERVEVIVAVHTVGPLAIHPN